MNSTCYDTDIRGPNHTRTSSELRVPFVVNISTYFVPNIEDIVNNSIYMALKFISSGLTGRTVVAEVTDTCFMIVFPLMKTQSVRAQ